MQQKYGTALAGKTPDVAEANLGAKGSYHRLIVGPPGSREQASAVCVQLKAEGYNGLLGHVVLMQSRGLLGSGRRTALAGCFL